MELRGGSGLEAPQCSIDFMITSAVCVTAAVRLYLRPQVDKSAHVYVTTELVMQIMIKRKAIYLSLVT